MPKTAHRTVRSSVNKWLTWSMRVSARRIWPRSSNRRGGKSPIQASVWNVRTLLRMRREMTNGKHHEEGYRCRGEGRSCS